MALELQLIDPIEVTSDGKLITVEDDTGTGNSGWGTLTNPDFTTIDGATNFLELEVTRHKYGVDDVTYDTIDLYTHIGGAPAALEDLVFNLDGSVLEVSGEAIGTSETVLDEGFYKFTYSLWDSNSPTRTDSNKIDEYITYQVIAPVTIGLVYKEVAKIADLNPYDDRFELNNRLYPYTYLSSILTDVSFAEKDRIVKQIYQLGNMLS